MIMGRSNTIWHSYSGYRTICIVRYYLVFKQEIERSRTEPIFYYLVQYHNSRVTLRLESRIPFIYPL